MKIITHPQSRAYDEGWDAIFGKKPPVLDRDVPAPDSPPESDTPPETGQVAPERGIRRPRGWTPKNG